MHRPAEPEVRRRPGGGAGAERPAGPVCAEGADATSTADVLFAGKKRITLSGGGSYLKIDANGVEYGTTGIYMRRMKLTLKRVKDAAEMDFPSVSVELMEDGAEGAVPLTIPLFPEQYPVFKKKICIECLLNAIKANDAVVQGA